MYPHPQPLKFLEILDIVTGGCVDLREPLMVAAPKKVAKPRNVYDQA
jgi:hypothetical protein